MAKKVKIVHLISGLQVGGAETVLYQLVDSLDRRQFSQIIVYFHEGPFVEKMEELGVPTYHVSGLFFQYDFIFLYRLLTLMRHLKPTCLHTVLWAAGFWGRFIGWFFKIPTVHACHNLVAHNGYLRNFLDRLTGKFVDHTIAVSEGIACSIDKQAPWMKKHPVKVIKNGLDVEQIKIWARKEKKQRADLGIAEKSIVIGSVGRFEPSKNFSLLLTSFALLFDHHRSTYLLLIGTGRQEHFLRKRASDLGIEERVIFVTDERAYGYYNLMDCFVSASLIEGLSMALLEAMSLGIPPVVTSPNKEHEVIEHAKTGLLVQPQNAFELSRALRRMIKGKALRQELGKEAALTVEKFFTAETMVKEYGNFYKDLVEQRA